MHQDLNMKFHENPPMVS